MNLFPVDFLNQILKTIGKILWWKETHKELNVFDRVNI